MPLKYAPPWRPIAEARKDNTLYALLIETGDEEGGLSVNPIEDEALSRTVGFNNDDNVTEDCREGWQFAGWCWSHDHFTDGRGKVVAFAELPVVLGEVAARGTP